MTTRKYRLSESLTDLSLAGTSHLKTEHPIFKAHYDRYLEHRKRLFLRLEKQGVKAQEDEPIIVVPHDDRVDVYLYDYIDQAFGAAAGDFVKPLTDSADRKVPLNIHINSLGGDVWEALTMRDLMLRHQQPINARVQGICASAATIVALSSNDIEISPEGTFMVHNAYVIMRGNAKELRQMADECEKTDRSIVAIYAERTGRPEAEIEGYMAESRSFLGQEAVDVGFCGRLTAESTTSDATKSLERTEKDLQMKRRNLAAMAEAFTLLGETE